MAGRDLAKSLDDRVKEAHTVDRATQGTVSPHPRLLQTTPPPGKETRMKALLVCLLLLSSYANAQDFPKSFNAYETEKKEKATGYLLSLVLPGGGLFYCGETLPGLAALGINGLLFIDAAHGSERTQALDILGLIIVRAVEFVAVSNLIDSYNIDLRVKLRLFADKKGISLGLSIPI